jgi:hypothetical protein
MHIRITFSSNYTINIFIQVMHPNSVTYLDRTLKDEQNYINFNMK